MLHLAGRDARLLQERRVLAFQTDQLLRAVASISANIAEGLGRQSTTERSRFFGIALGSLREAITWYHAVADELPASTVPKRLEQLTELRTLLIGAQKWLSSRPQGARLM
jgi:four helix bundle protein